MYFALVTRTSFSRRVAGLGTHLAPTHFGGTYSMVADGSQMDGLEWLEVKQKALKNLIPETRDVSEILVLSVL